MALTLLRFLVATDLQDPNYRPNGVPDSLDVQSLRDELTQLVRASPARQRVKLTAAEVMAHTAPLQATKAQYGAEVPKYLAAWEAYQQEINKAPPPANVPALQAMQAACISAARWYMQQIATIDQQINSAQNVTRIAVAPQARLDLKWSQPERRVGWIATIEQYTGNIQEPVIEEEAIAVALVDALNAKLQAYYYGVLQDGQRIPGYQIDPISKNKIPLPSPALANYLRLDLFSSAYLGIITPIRAVDLGLLLRPPGEPLYNTNYYNWRYVRMGVDPNRTDDYRIWVPNILPVVLFDPNEDRCLEPDQNGDWVLTKVGRTQVGCYGMGPGANNELVVKPLAVDFGAKGVGRGGGGAMRADRPKEIKYRWDGDVTLGRALALTAALRAPPAANSDFKASPGDRPRTMKTQVHGDMAGVVTYWREFVDPPLMPKKNRPLKTIPYDFTSMSKAQDVGMYGLGALTKKRKGQWNLASGEPVRTGESLRHQQGADRLDAGDVMEEAFHAAGLLYPGGANDFVAAALLREQVLATQWATLSANIQPRQQYQADLPAEKASFRADQEWCHLYGHGDGGDESLENFVSGSKHCNTFQLGIETGQRYGAYANLTAKITGYTLSNVVFPKKQFTQLDLVFIKLFSPNLFNPQHPEQWAAIAAAYIDPNGGKNFIDLLPAQGAGSTMVPTQAVYNALEDSKKATVKKRILERLLEATCIPLPIGAVIRYKIYYNATKIFDVAFPGQKESFDLNEFNILYWTVRRAIADATGTRPSYDAALALKALQNPAAS